MSHPWPGPPGNSVWWDHPEADPLQDMRDFAARIGSMPQTVQPPLVPEWMQKRWHIDVWGNPL